ncbi:MULTISPECIES: amino acid ABC transporter permease [Ensifer]|jgi:polar amino acid transport system permease protein|uniref:Glutamate/aspartate import permease protein GltK n=1 Tax=Ensifer canadensis TaxID=555315 RepID=A0AAW4FSI8_9HYPH|nr:MULTISPECIES: amino acid ABC transporter permease [Ensifer]AHK46487.1 putative amino acid ABC transporter, permease protein [Ensifer adhaerens OV14]MDP9632751.1 polar amino acid transport system permease protein [Ensifer adhaerens]KQW59176.1 ABC transporter permease [Ensifer sp. Root1252]KQW79508.1 ABC transporter permease [Ensifer sp. Root127]KQY72541.1 ABC transporter permease [Ensifer sp. Root142]
MSYNWDFHSVWQYYDLFLWGLWITVVYTFSSIFFGVIIGFITCAARLSGWKLLNLTARAYQEIFRCTPLLVQLLWFYYAFPLLIGGSVDNRVAAMLTLSLYVGAFYAEIFRGGIVSIDKGQREAAAAIGMSPMQSMSRIILPQALKRVLPSFINQSVIQFKNTSLVSVISVADLAYMAAVVNGQTYRPLESYTVMAALYIAMLLPLTQAADWIEKRLRVSD